MVPGLNVLESLPARKPLGQIVYEKLKQAVVKGALESGSRIIESQVAESLSISRTPVREAMHKLEREGLLRQSPTGGYFVVGLSRMDIEETFGIRSVLESYAARLAAIKHRKEELMPLQNKISEYQECLEREQIEDLPRINTEFHDLLYGLSYSPRLIKMINDLKDYIYRYREVILKIEDMAMKSNEDHRRMLALIKIRDADGVERIVREHILRGQEVVLRQFDNQQMVK
ncbi:MAG: GntR family transcriptional regulator [Deltaproteobacteria bacterium]|nr:GntR family transcriptional regulator [Deltaproteobacteria bacterium]